MLDKTKPHHCLNTTNESLQEAWLLRGNQRIDESMMALAKIQVQENWEMLSPDQLSLLPAGPFRENYLEALLLKSSFLRAQGQEQKSSALLRRILNKNTELSDVTSFRLMYELGLDCWRREDIAQAMDYFFLAEKKARNSIERISSLSNLLWCLEALDLNRHSVLKRIEDLFLEIQADGKTNYLKNFLEQFSAYKMRSSFYQTMTILDLEVSGQAQFFKQWVHELPYMTTASNSEINMPDYLWQNSYRMRTLNGLWSPTDRSVSKAGDAIDRLYLWVWKWIAGEHISTEKIAWTLESILQQLDLEAQSRENLLLMRNACSWIVFLEPQLEVKLQNTLRRLQKISSAHYAVLESEFLLIQCLSEKDSSDLVSSLDHFPVFAKIFKRKIKYPRLEKKLELLEILNNKKGNGHSIQVDLTRNRIILLESNRHISSPSLTLLIQLVEENERVPFQLFGIDSEPRAIYNLATRLRKIFPKNALMIEQQELFKGPKWPKILIMKKESQFDAETIPLTDSHSSGHKLKFVGSPEFFQAARALLPSVFTRLELEKNLRISKATACRILDEWLRHELITKSGKARNVTYSWKENR